MSMAAAGSIHERTAREFFRRFAPLLGLDGNSEDMILAGATTDEIGRTHLRFTHCGIAAKSLAKKRLRNHAVRRYGPVYGTARRGCRTRDRIVHRIPRIRAEQSKRAHRTSATQSRSAARRRHPVGFVTDCLARLCEHAGLCARYMR